ncbi:MAG: thioesterase family protein [Myxococcota bacterium]|nr:thioesterase family protein [Myxococcota bacterium]
MTTPFETVLETTPPSISEDWLQGRTSFGGILGALALKELLALVDKERRPLSLNLQFIRPVYPETVNIKPTIIRAGKYLTQGHVSIKQAGKIAVEGQVVFGTSRASAFQLKQRTTNLSKSIEEAQPLSETASHHFPKFIQHFECHYTESGFPFSGEGRGEIGGFCKHRQRAIGFPALVALLDAWPPTLLPMYQKPVPASTVHWHVQFYGESTHSIDFSQEFCEYHATTLQADAGFTTTDALISLNGQTLASGRQLVAFFE